MDDGDGGLTMWFSSQMVVFGLYEIRNKNIQDLFLTFRKQQVKECKQILASEVGYNEISVIQVRMEDSYQLQKPVNQHL